jgi:glutathione S-transferase
MPRILYHFPLSPFSRRTRLALAHKGLEVELRDGRANPAFVEESRRLVPTRTTPVLVEADGRALGDSLAIAHYLDRAYPDLPALWPSVDAFEVFETIALVNVAIDTLVDLGTRYFSLRGDAAWSGVAGEMVGRAQAALDALGARAAARTRPTVSSGGWSAADMWLCVATAWLESLPARAPTTASAAQVVSLGWTVPASLSRWADAHRERADVKAL